MRLARINLAAFRANLERFGGETFDARANAYGYGLRLLAPIALAAGVSRILVSDEREAMVARECGFTKILVDRVKQVSAETVLLYGAGDDCSPVMTLCAELIQVKSLPPGEGVSYGYSYYTTTDTTVGLVALGYADGVPRISSNRAELYIAGKRCALVGLVAMDQLMIELAGDTPCPGTTVVVFGNPERGEPSLAQWARWSKRHSLTLTAGLGARIIRETE